MLALLHTSPVHVPVFDALRDRDHPGTELLHLVDEELLERARAQGPGAGAVAEGIGDLLGQAAAAGAGAVLCTCSTIGAAAEGLGTRAGISVLRVDRPMAAEAVAMGSRIVVAAALESTPAPTTALIQEEAERAGRAVRVRTLLAPGAWDLFTAGDRAGYLAAVAATVATVTAADVVVLAQASMADAEALTPGTVPVLSSPRPGLRAAVAALRARSGDQGNQGRDS